MGCLGEAARRLQRVGFQPGGGGENAKKPTGLHLKIGAPLENWKPLLFRDNMFFCGIFWWFHEKTA